jgi:hypothetical protein
MGWLPSAPVSAGCICAVLVLQHIQWRTVYEGYDIGVDLAKRIFQVHGAPPSGDFVYRK